MKLFVKKSDRVEINVYITETEDGVIEASSTIPENAEKSDCVKFYFRHPNYSDSKFIMSSYSYINGSVDPVQFQENILKRLLADWDLTNDDGEKVPCTPESINNLLPQVARAAVSGVLEKISI